MPTSNPVLSEKAINRASGEFGAGWAAPTAPGLGAPSGSRRSAAGTVEPMTMGGVLSACGVLLVLVVAAAAFGWSQVDQTTAVNEAGQTVNTTSFPAWTMLVGLAAIVLGIVTSFKPRWARVTSPIYALGIGVFLGAISAVYENSWNGIVSQAILCTMGVFVTMLFLYATRIIRVTRKLAMGIVAATGGVVLVYLVSFVWGLISGSQPSIFGAGLVGIGFSVLVVGIAAFNLLLDFDFIERGVNQGLPRGMEWYAAFGLLVTLVWLYLEILRLLAKLRQ